MAEPTPVLQFEAAHPESPDHPGGGLRGVTFTLKAGSSAVVHAAQPHDLRDEGLETMLLADAAEGLIPCREGRVLFKGRAWAAMSPLEQSRNRGHIGRLFDFHGWVYNLSVMENLTLACQSVHARPAREGEAEVRQMARRFGLEGVPDGRPVLFRKRDLRIYEWIRAFQCRPDLVILERPELELPLSALDVCFDLAREALAAGSALLWITHDKEMVGRAVRLGAKAFAIQGRTWPSPEEKKS
jgi:ABC-type lipoprotein export system ATPase subunit